MVQPGAATAKNDKRATFAFGLGSNRSKAPGRYQQLQKLYNQSFPSAANSAAVKPIVASQQTLPFSPVPNGNASQQTVQPISFNLPQSLGVPQPFPQRRPDGSIPSTSSDELPPEAIVEGVLQMFEARREAEKEMDSDQLAALKEARKESDAELLLGILSAGVLSQSQLNSIRDIISGLGLESSSASALSDAMTKAETVMNSSWNGSSYNVSPTASQVPGTFLDGSSNPSTSNNNTFNRSLIEPFLGNSKDSPSPNNGRTRIDAEKMLLVGPDGRSTGIDLTKPFIGQNPGSPIPGDPSYSGSLYYGKDKDGNIVPNPGRGSEPLTTPKDFSSGVPGISLSEPLSPTPDTAKKSPDKEFNLHNGQPGEKSPTGEQHLSHLGTSPHKDRTGTGTPVAMATPAPSATPKPAGPTHIG